MARVIDVWDVETFDEELMTALHESAELVLNYLDTDRELSFRRETAEFESPNRSNPYAAGYHELLEDLSRKMDARTIRGWHYTRLTDPEVEKLRTTGIYLSTLETTRQRLNSQVACGQVSVEIAEALLKASPLQNREQRDARSHRFWMTSHPVGIDDDDVNLLLGNWGGEAIYSWLEDPSLQQIVSTIGKPRVLEVAVPLKATSKAFYASKAVVAAFADVLGCIPNFRDFDICCVSELGPEVILAVHSEGEVTYSRIANGHPTTFRPKRE